MERLEITKKIGNIKEIFHGRVGTVKDRNGRNLTDKRVKKWQEYKELYRKSLNDMGNMIAGHSTRAKYPGVWSRVGLKKLYYE